MTGAQAIPSLFCITNTIYYSTMPKMKTRKALAKKVKISGSGKVLRRATGQNHFNAKEPGKVTRRKRSDAPLPKAEAKNIRRALNV